MFSKRYMGSRLTTAFILSFFSVAAFGQFEFTNVSDESGILPFDTNGMTAGAAAVDYDADGDIDIFVPTANNTPDQFYRNRGDGTFDEVAGELGLDSYQNGRAALWFDYDGDHLLDLVVVGDCWAVTGDCGPFTIHLYRQSSPDVFEDVTTAAGITDDLIGTAADHRNGIAVGDINNDGYLDLLLAVWKVQGRVLLNDTEGGFTDISATSGLGELGTSYWQQTFYDWNGDGWQDIYVTYDFGDDELWINQQDNTFENVAATVGTANPWNGMGTALGDYDNDGDLDIYVTNIAQFSRHNMFYRNDSVGSSLSFTEISADLEMGDTGFGWGCTFFDANNDGYLDLAVTNGFNITPFHDDQSRFFLNNGDSPTTFSDVTRGVGFNDQQYGSALMAFDIERDGDLDMLHITRDSSPLLRLMKNTPDEGGPQSNYLVIKPRMDGPNHWAIGAVVRVSAGGKNMMRLITAGISMHGQEPAEAHFGLGTSTIAEEVTIEWPDGTESVFNNLPANGVYTTLDGALINLDGDTDGDGLDDLYEIDLGTETMNRDTDGDTVSDGMEVAWGTDPLDPEDTPAVPLSTIWTLALLCLVLGTFTARFLKRT